MSALNIFTKRRFGLDYSVWIVMIVITMIAMAFAGYGFISNEQCVPGILHINGKAVQNTSSYFPGQQLTFSLSTEAGNTVVWSFGDNTDTTEGTNVYHVFEKEKRYQVTATINGKCEQMALVRIKSAPVAPDRYSNMKIEIVGNTYTVEGAIETYTSNVVADKYLWRILNKESAQAQKTSNAVFTFPKDGIYTIELMLDSTASRVITKEVTVFKKMETQTQVQAGGPEKIPVLIKRETPGVPPPVVNTGADPSTVPQQSATPPVVVAPANAAVKAKKKDVLPETFKIELDDVIALKKTPEEVAETYLFYGGTTRVKVNKEKTTKTFTEFCYQMRATKKYELVSVQLDKDDSGITVINAEVDKRGLFNRVFGKKK